MSTLATVSDPVAAPAVVKAGVPAKRRRLWILPVVAVLLCPAALALPPVWHGAVRSVLHWQAARLGYDLNIARIGGGPFGETQLEGVQLRQPGANAAEGTDLSAERVRFTLVWPGHGESSWVREISAEDVRGRLDLTRGRAPAIGTSHGFGRTVARWVPEAFAIRATDLQLRRGAYTARVAGLRLSGLSNQSGEVDLRLLEVAGPGFARTFVGRHGQTFWKGSRLTITGLDLGGGVALTTATLDGSHLGRRRLDWECTFAAADGEVRGQGAVSFAHEKLALEVAATLRRTALAPFARALGITAPVDGQVEEASFTFRGSLDDPADAQTWLSARVKDFHWGSRRWQSLDAQAVVVNRRVQIHRFELRQSGNNLSLSGECPLPPADTAALAWTGEDSWWRAAGFSCNVDARLEDLRGLAALFGPGVPALAGRMSLNGRLGTAPGHTDMEGYLNVEGTRLTIRGAPLDYLRSTLIFRGGALEVADVQATNGADYFTSHGGIRLFGAPDYRGEWRAQIKDLGVYAPALVGLPWVEDGSLASVQNVNATLRLEDGVLRFERCEGEQAGEPFEVTGSVDLRHADAAGLNVRRGAR